jgi:uncharacterized protein YndB with AHSA1/START domain
MADVEVSTEIAAPAPRVWELIGDPTRMGEWSPETTRVTWARGSSAPAVRAQFKGSNRLGWRRWSTLATITEYSPNQGLAWDVDFGPFAVAHWAYRIEPAGTGCRVVESFTDRRGGLFMTLGPLARGVKDVAVHNRAGMEQTLARIKAAAEATS